MPQGLTPSEYGCLKHEEHEDFTVPWWAVPSLGDRGFPDMMLRSFVILCSTITKVITGPS
jgi:hypothetical protein